MWEWLVVGFLVFGIGIGPLAGSRAGKRVGAWARGLEMQTRAAGIIAVVVAIYGLFLFIEIPPNPAFNVTVGGAFAVVGHTIVHGIHSWRRHH